MSRVTATAALAGRYRGYAGSGEHAAVAVLLCHEPVAAAAKFCRYASGRGIDWDAVLAEAWSPAERLLIATAAGLWSGRRTPVDISRAAFLDDGQFAVWQAILTAHRTGQAPAAPAEPGGGGRRG
ncbi:MAG: hypothetical protein J2P30_21365 [Actinobacteria bacterium]|nr:hypothetical protein [Actinomycetota bacterium]